MALNLKRHPEKKSGCMGGWNYNHDVTSAYIPPANRELKIKHKHINAMEYAL